MNQTLKNLEVILAGGSGGLGSATAELLAAEGAKLTVSYFSNADRAQKLAAIATVQQADLINPEHRTRLLDCAPALHGLVVFTGDPSRVKNLDDFERVALRAQEINYLGPIMLAREAAARMRASNTPGSIVLFS